MQNNGNFSKPDNGNGNVANKRFNEQNNSCARAL